MLSSKVVSEKGEWRNNTYGYTLSSETFRVEEYNFNFITSKCDSEEAAYVLLYLSEVRSGYITCSTDTKMRLRQWLLLDKCL
jgi:hypothetical protein